MRARGLKGFAFALAELRCISVRRFDVLCSALFEFFWLAVNCI